MKLIMENWRKYIAESVGFGEGQPPSGEFYKKQVIELEEEAEAAEEEGVDWVGVVLDALGLVPVVGEPADAFQSLRHMKRGEYFYALMSLISIIPELGDLIGKSTKYITKGGGALAKLFKGGKAAGAVTKATAATVKTAKGVEKILGHKGTRAVAKFVKDHDQEIRTAIATFQSEEKAMAESIIINEQEAFDDPADQSIIEGFFEFLDDLINYADEGVDEEPDLGLGGEPGADIETELHEDEEYFMV